MDNISHTLVGAALGQAGLKKRTGLGMATLMIAANIPDLDGLAMFTEHALTFRRGWTHGPVGLALLPVLLTAFMVGLDRLQHRLGRRPMGRLPVRPWQVLLLAYIGALSHPFLDWLNTYGIRLLMPFSHEWFYGDALFIVDPWLWMAMGLGIFLSRRREKHERTAPFRPAQVALGMLAVYIGLMVFGSRDASRAADRELAAQGIAPVERIMAGPVPLNPFRRRIIFDTGDAYGFGTLSWSPGAEVHISPDRLPRNDDHPAVQRALAYDPIQRFLYWSRFPFFEIEDHPAGQMVHAGDARFQTDATSGWARVGVLVEDEPANPPR
jgi:inner membrane protein